MFEVPQSGKAQDGNRFRFSFGGGEYSLPLLRFAPVESAEHFEAGRNVAGILACCENDAARDAVRSMDGEQFGALMSAWGDASGVSVGESGASLLS